MGQIWAEVARDLADTTIIPLNVVDFADKVNNLVKTLEKDYGDILKNNGVAFGEL